MKWSEQQERIFDEVAHGSGNLVIEARAGSGKTSTAVEALGHVRAGESCMMTAFNRTIARELQDRAPSHVRVSTLHSYGYGAVRRAYPNVKVSEDRDRTLLVKHFEKVPAKLRNAACKLTSLAKQHLLPKANGIAPEAQLDRLLDLMWVIDADDAERLSIVAMALWLIEQARDPIAAGGFISFDDQPWLVIVNGLSTYQHDYVFVDEAQDLSACQHALVAVSVKKYGRLAAIGDSFQSIYGWAGATQGSMGQLKRKFSAQELPLSVTYRCPKKVVEAVHAYVPDLTAAEGNPEGIVADCSEDKMLADAHAGDFILSRVNAPLVKHCLSFIRAGKRACILGRNIGKSMGSLVEQSHADDVPALERFVQSWCDKEVARILKRDPEAEVGHLGDRRDCMLALCDRADSVGQVRERIDQLFGDGNPFDCIALSSTHRAKGLERDRVFMLRDTYLRGRQPSGEERNLYYVACTRARQELYFVRTPREA